MVAQNQQLRKAAVLFARLDREQADLLLARMSAAQAQRVRQAVVELGDVSDDEEEDALAELSRRGNRGNEYAAAQADLPGIDLEDRLTRRLAANVRDEVSFDLALDDEPQKAGDWHDEAPFRFLHEARMDELADRLGREHPQAIAVVLAYLPPSRAAEALSALAEPVQVEVVRRLSQMEPTDAVVVREIEEALRRWIAPAVESGKPSVGMTAAQRILSSTSSTTQRHLLDALAECDESLAHRLGRPRTMAAPTPPVRTATVAKPLSFAEVEAMLDAEIAPLWTKVDRQIAVFALAAASPEFVDRVVDAVDEPLARAICHDLDNLGAVSLADLDAAQLVVGTAAAEMRNQRKRHAETRAAAQDFATTIAGGVVV
jgi:flagellar motor switch protein FliG